MGALRWSSGLRRWSQCGRSAVRTPRLDITFGEKERLKLANYLYAAGPSQITLAETDLSRGWAREIEIARAQTIDGND